MNKTRVFLLGLAAALLVIVLWFLLRFGNTPAKPQMQAKPSGQPETGAQQETHPPNMESGPTSSQEIKKHIRSLAYQPIEFYGKLVDQFGSPVAGAEITGSVLAGDGVSTSKTTTDGVGQFQFKGLKGMDLGIMARKSGYEFLAKNTSFVYALFRPEKVHKPDPNNPVVFQMWKLAGPESLIHIDEDFRIPYDGRAAVFDLLTGKKVDRGGDIRLTLVRSPLKIQRGKEKFDWTLKVEAVEGGLIETKDDFMYLAPENDYQPALYVDMLKDNPKWSSSIDLKFYLRSRLGKHHARVQLGVSADSERENTGITIRSWLNPSGSRNLEYDPSKKIN